MGANLGGELYINCSPNKFNELCGDLKWRTENYLASPFAVINSNKPNFPVGRVAHW